jgi:hypothetical protein
MKISTILDHIDNGHMAWPNGIQEELSQPVAVLLKEDSSTIALASQAGFRCFTDVAAVRKCVEAEVLGMN